MTRLSRADLHVHSRFSNKPSIWAMRKINCPESYKEPEHIYRTAKAKGMDFITITDNKTIQCALEIAHLPGAFISVELTLVRRGHAQIFFSEYKGFTILLPEE